MKGGVKYMGKIPLLNECKPGIQPTEYNVLIVPAVTEEVTKGGIILTSQTKQQQDISGVQGRILAISPHAFSYVDSWGDGQKPEIGDVVLFAKFAGTLVEGNDGREYRLLKDKDICAKIEGL